MGVGTESPGESLEVRGVRGIQVITRAAEILRALRAATDGLTQTEVGERLGLARSTVHRILNALEDEGLVASTGPRGRYRLGPEISRMVDAAQRSFIAQVRPYLEALSRAVNETVDLSVLEGDHATFIDQVEAAHRLRAVSAIGETFPLHCTANGKSFLASMSPPDLTAMLPARLPRLTPHTFTNLSDLQQELEQVRAEGVAYDREEHTEGICAVGTILRGVPGRPVSVSVPLPAQRFYGQEARLHDTLLEHARQIEASFEPAHPLPGQ